MYSGRKNNLWEDLKYIFWLHKHKLDFEIIIKARK